MKIKQEIFLLTNIHKLINNNIMYHVITCYNLSDNQF